MGIGWRAIIRSAIWLVAALIALYPVCHAVHLRPTLNLVSLAVAANNKLLFRDFFFIVVVLVATSFGNVLYAFTREAVPSWFRGISVLACLYYVYVLTYGVSRFAELTEMAVPIGLGDLHDDLTFMGVAIVITLLAELAISLTEDWEPTIEPPVGSVTAHGGRQ